jgi:hypothetical protein
MIVDSAGLTPSATMPDDSKDEPPKGKPLGRRDLILLPLISLLTILLMTGVAELLARRMWAEKLRDDCEYHSKLLGDRHRANCVMLMKNIEGPWVRYQMNDCGYRGTASCGPKPPGTMRVVIMGTSIAFGLHVPYEEYFANVAAPELTKLWHHPVEFQNLGDVGPDWSKSDIVLDEMLALKPDAVIYMAVPFDLNRMDTETAPPAKNLLGRAAEEERALTWTDVRVAAKESRVLIVAQHFMLRDENFFLRAFEDYADPLDVSRVPTPPAVEERFQRIDKMIGRLADRTRAAGVPSYMIALPNRVESALISKNIQLPHMDAMIFPTRMGEIARKHDMGYIDTVPELKKTPNAEQLFYAVDGHPAGGAHALMARAVIDYFETHKAPALSRVQ